MTKTLKVLTKEDVRTLLTKQIASAGGVRELARRHTVSPIAISKASKPNGPLRPAIIAMLGLEKNEETYVRKNVKKQREGR